LGESPSATATPLLQAHPACATVFAYLGGVYDLPRVATPGCETTTLISLIEGVVYPRLCFYSYFENKNKKSPSVREIPPFGGGKEEKIIKTELRFRKGGLLPFSGCACATALPV